MEQHITETLASMKGYYYHLKEFKDDMLDGSDLDERYHSVLNFLVSFRMTADDWFDRIDDRSPEYIAEKVQQVEALEFKCHDALQWLPN